MKSYKTFKIQNKDIFVFEEHQYALFPWAELKRRLLEDDIFLVTFDTHTDLHKPFMGLCGVGGFDYDFLLRNKVKEYGYEFISGTTPEMLISEIDYQNESSIIKAVAYLRNDEHIKTAIQTNIIRKAFVISHEDGNCKDDIVTIRDSKEEMEYQKEAEKDGCGGLIYRLNHEPFDLPFEKRTYPDSKIYQADDVFLDYVDEKYLKITPDTNDVFLDDDYLLLDDDYLESRFDFFNKGCPHIVSKTGLIQGKYILDIDLDYFYIEENLEPKNFEIFKNLVKNAEIITIALEPYCVEMVQTDRYGEDYQNIIKSDKLLNKLKELINKCLRDESNEIFTFLNIINN
jgi:hypothetical protein